MKIGIGGAYKDVDKIFVGVGGMWKEAEKMFANIGGGWKEAEGLGLQGSYIFCQVQINSTYVYQRLKLNPITLATIQTVEVTHKEFAYDHGSIPGKIIAIEPGVYLHELNIETFSIISSTRIIYSDGGETIIQRNKVGGTLSNVYTSHYVTYYGEYPGESFPVYRRNTTTYSAISQINEKKNSGINGIDGVGSRLYSYYHYNGYESLRELNPETLLEIRSSTQSSNRFGSGLSGGSDGTLIGALLGGSSPSIVSYNINSLAAINSTSITSAIHVGSVLNLK